MPRRHAVSRPSRSWVNAAWLLVYPAAVAMIAALAGGTSRVAAQEERSPTPVPLQPGLAAPTGEAPQPAGDAVAPAPENTPEREQFLLREACRYLKLTPALAAHLLPIARLTERRRALFQMEAEQGQRALDALAPNQEQEAARIHKILEEDQGKAYGEITTYAAPQVARLFTREQIALAYRLLQGNPPVYTHPDPALTESGSGFTQGSQFGGPGAIIYLRGGSDQFRLENESVPRTGAVSVKSYDVLLDARREQLSLQDEAVRRSYDGLITDLDLATGLLSRAGSSNKPFPQWVVETDDFAGLTSTIQPLVQRLFTSAEWVAVLQDGLRHGFGAVTRVSVPSGAGRIVRDYRMERGLRDLSGHGPDLEPLGGEVQNGLYQFGPGQGLHAADLGVTDHYSLELIVRYFGGDSYQKIIDFKNLAKDIGFYYYQGHLDFYQMASGGAPQPGLDHRLRLERNRATRIVRGYQDGRLIFSFIDLDDDAVFDKGAGTFFVDDKATSGEQGPGALTSLLVWGGPINR